MYKFEPLFKIGDHVFHATKESDEGIIINITYNVRQRAIQYEVMFGRMDADDVWCYEEELSDTKRY